MFFSKCNFISYQCPVNFVLNWCNIRNVLSTLWIEMVCVSEWLNLTAFTDSRQCCPCKPYKPFLLHMKQKMLLRQHTFTLFTLISMFKISHSLRLLQKYLPDLSLKTITVAVTLICLPVAHREGLWWKAIENHWQVKIVVAAWLHHLTFETPNFQPWVWSPHIPISPLRGELYVNNWYQNGIKII